MAQDPGLTSVVVSPNPIAVNAVGTALVQFTNTGAPLPVGGVQITVSFGSNFSYDPVQLFSQTNGSNVTTSDFSVVSWNPGPVHSVVLQNNAVIPAGINGARKLTIQIKGTTVTAVGAPQNVNVQLEPLGAVIASNLTTNDQVTTNAVVVPAAALPLQLLSFTGTRKLEMAELNWVTAEEENTSHFEIERSSDVSGWANVGRVQAKGHMVARSNYSATDNLKGISGNVYYRLKMVDRDETFTYSRVVKLSIGEGETSYSVYPSLVKQGGNITIAANQGAATGLSVLISNTQGQVVRQLRMDGQLLVSTADLAGGQYYVKISDANSVVYTTKFIVQ